MAITSSNSSGRQIEPVAGYYVDPHTKAWCTSPWPGDRSLPYSHPERMCLLPPSLGMGAIKWAHQNLVHHLTGKPWRFTQGQSRFLMLWYGVNVEAERWVYRTGVKRGAKGTGKDPFLAAWSLIEMFGPIRLHDIDNGIPIGAAHRLPLVQIAANSEDQAKDVLRIANAMLTADLKDEHGIFPGKTVMQTHGGGMIQVLTNSEESAEGDIPTAGGLNESHHMTEQKGTAAIAEVVRRNLGKSPKDIQARGLEFTNAHVEGGESVAEASYIEWQNQVTGVSPLRDMLYDSIEALPGTDIYDPAELEAGLRAAYSDAPWADLERQKAEALDSRTGVSQALRFYLNIVAANEESWVEPKNFKAMARPDKELVDRDPIALFLDCSKNEDATALVGCRISDGHVFTVKVWKRPPGKQNLNMTAPREEFRDAIYDYAERYRLCWLGIDPGPAEEDSTSANYWIPTIDSIHQKLHKKLMVWATPGRHSVMYDLRTSQPGGRERNQKIVQAALLAASEIDAEVPADQKWSHDGDPDLIRHVDHARRHPTPWGVSLGKVNRDSPLSMDAAFSMVGARMGAQTVLNSGKLKTRSKPKAVVYT